MRELQQLLAHHFGREEPFRLIGQVVSRIERLPFGHPVDQQLLQAIDVLSGGRRDRDDLRKQSHLRVAIDDRQQLRFANEIDLVEQQEDR